MKNNYRDILDRISEKPLWWDEHGVPRYISFHPGKAANVYAGELALLEIQCQSCGEEFLVTASVTERDRRIGDATNNPIESLAEKIKHQTLGYGDPPNSNCCASGHTMTSVPIRVLEYWKRNRDTQFGWERDSNFEIEFEPMEDVEDTLDFGDFTPTKIFEKPKKPKINGKVFSIFNELKNYLSERKDWALVRHHKDFEDILHAHLDRLSYQRINMSDLSSLCEENFMSIEFMVHNGMNPNQYGEGWVARFTRKGFSNFFQTLVMMPTSDEDIETIEEYLEDLGITIYEEHKGLWCFTGEDTVILDSRQEALLSALNHQKAEAWLSDL